VLPDAKSYEALQAGFSWRVPARYNIAVDVCDRWARDPNRLALIHKRADGSLARYSFLDLQRGSNRLANLLAAQGIGRGERVGILLPQAPETALAHLATYKLGAIAVPLFTLFGPDALEFRLRDSGARALITDSGGLAKLAEIEDRLPDLEVVLSVDGATERALDLHGQMARAAESFRPVDTGADEPALIIYTSGTTGPPKGALHDRPRARSTPTGCCSAICPGSNCPKNYFPNRATCSGRRRTGPGSAGSWTCSCRPGITACRSWRTASPSSTRNRPSNSWPRSGSAMPSCRPPR
jgi:acyl-CoA synthetase (AMP-forming)/AMP-acid ligase II